jgi:hypothetical protein
MSVTSEFAPGSNVLLLFKCELQEERSRLTRAIESTHKKIRTLADSGRAMSQMSPQSTRPSEHHSFQNVAKPRAGKGSRGEVLDSTRLPTW